MQYKSVPDADKGGRISGHFADIIYGVRRQLPGLHFVDLYPRISGTLPLWPAADPARLGRKKWPQNMILRQSEEHEPPAPPEVKGIGASRYTLYYPIGTPSFFISISQNCSVYFISMSHFLSLVFSRVGVPHCCLSGQTDVFFGAPRIFLQGVTGWPIRFETICVVYLAIVQIP